MRCSECGDVGVASHLPNKPLDAICSKYDFKLGALKSIQKAVGAAGSGGG